MRGAELVRAGQAPAAGVARHDDLHGDPVAGLHAPPGRRALADLLDDAERLVPRHEGPRLVLQHRPEMAPVRLDVAAADPVGLDAQQTVVGADPRSWELAYLDLARSDLYGRAYGFRHALSEGPVVRCLTG
ncbi:hypothetical protein GCM10020001_005970 [Nonomuraea salmonea]